MSFEDDYLVVILSRHAISVTNGRSKKTSIKDLSPSLAIPNQIIPLTAEGEKQGYDLGRHVAGDLQNGTFLILSSHYTRAIRTASAAKIEITRLGRKVLGPITTPYLREFNSGTEATNDATAYITDLYGSRDEWPGQRDTAHYFSYYPNFDPLQRPIDGDSIADVDERAGVVASDLKEFAKTRDLKSLKKLLPERLQNAEINTKGLCIGIVSHSELLKRLLKKLDIKDLPKDQRVRILNAEPIYLKIDRQGNVNFLELEHGLQPGLGR